MLGRLAKEAYEDYTRGAPRLSSLPTLIQLNIVNAVVRNAVAMGFSTDYVAVDTLSPLNTQPPGCTYPLPESCPDSLRPTALQLEIPHHPWVDLFPFPRMRDNLLRAGDAVDKEELCIDLFDPDQGVEKANLLVWGEPWDHTSWEASVAFLRKWGWLVRGCGELLEATNYWREKRGEERLVFETLVYGAPCAC
jgi:hypothetical protein